MSAAELAILITLKDQASKGLAGIGDTLGSGIGKAAKIGAAALVGIGVAAGAASVVSLKSFASFQQGMNEVFTLIPGAGKEAFDDLTKQTKSFAKDFGVLPDKVVPALYQALSAGVPRENVFKFLEVAQKAAVGGVTELTTAVDGISSVVNAYGADVLDATKASDLMFTAVRLGKTNFDELSRSLFQVTPTAAALGVNFGDVTAALAAMTAQGVPTSVATTQLRQLFVELSKEGTATSKVFQDMAGKSFKDFIAAGGNTQQALQLLEQHAADAGVSISDLFGSVEAGNAALALTGQGTDAFTSALAEMRASAGATDAAYEQMQTGLNRSIARIRAAFEVLKIEVGSRLAPVLAALLTFIIAKGIPAMTRLARLIEGPLTKGFTTARDSVLTFIEAIRGDWTDDTRILGLHRAIGLVGTAIHGLVSAFNEGGILGLLREMGSLAVSAFSGIDWAGIGQTILTGLSGALSTATGLAFDAGSWLLGMMTGVDWNSTARTIGQSILDGLATAGGWLFDAGKWVLDRFKDVAWIETGRALGQAILDAVVTATGYVWDVATWLGGIIAGVAWIDTGKAVGQAILDAVVTGAGYVWDAATWLSGLAQSVEWGALGTTIGQAILDAVTDAKALVWDAASWFVGILKAVDWKPVAEAIQQGIADAVGAVDFSALTSAISEQMRIEPDQEATSRWESWLQTLKPLIDPVATAVDNFGAAADRLWGSLGNVLGSVRDLVAAFAPWKELIEPLRPILDAIAGAGLWVLVQTMLTPLRWLTSQLEQMAGILDIVSVAARIATPIIEGVGNAFIWLRDNIPGALSAIESFASETIRIIGGLPGAVLGFFVALYTSAMEWFRATKDDSLRIVGEWTDGIITYLEGLPGRAVAALGDLYSLALELGKDFLRGIRDGLQDIPILGEIIRAVGWIGEQLGKIDVPGRSPVGHAGREIGEEFVTSIVMGILNAIPDLGSAVETIGKTLAGVVDAFDRLLDLGDRMAAGFTLPSMEFISDLKFITEHAVQSIADSAALFTTEGLEAAGRFADAGKAIFDMMGSAFDAFNRESFTVPTMEMVSDIKFLVEHAVRSIMDSAAMFEQEGLDAAMRFAEAGQSVMDLLGSVPESLADLSQFGEAATEHMADFASFIASAVLHMQTAAGWFTDEALESAVLFADAGQTIMDLMASVPESLADLAVFGEESSAHMGDFASFIASAVLHMKIAAGWFTDEGIDAAVKFAEAGKTIMDLFASAVNFSGFGDYSRLLVDEFDAFLQDVKTAVGMLIEVGAELGNGLIEAEAIAEKINTIVGLLAPNVAAGGTSGLVPATGGVGGGSGGSGGGVVTGSRQDTPESSRQSINLYLTARFGERELREIITDALDDAGRPVL